MNRIGYLLVPFAALALAGCGSDDEEPGGGGGSCEGVDTTGCAVALSPGADPEATYISVQGAFQDTPSGSTICFCPGTYQFEKPISLLNKPDMTVKGIGASRDDVVLDFAGQKEGDNAIKVDADNFTIENLSITESPGNGIVVEQADGVVFRNLNVSWKESVVTNGAYAVYPVSSSNVVVEDSTVIGAADAGIYVGQCTNVVVRNNVVHGNVAGIEIENSSNAEVYGNDAYDNTSGILVFVLPGLEKKDGNKTLVRDNNVHDNNRANFAEPGTIVANVPAGTGMLVLAADETEITNNTIENNGTTGVLILSLETLKILVGPIDDPATDPYPEATFIHDNTFTNNGTTPSPPFSDFNINPIENVVWDGFVDTAKTTTPLCLGDNPTTFRNLNAPAGLVDDTKHTTDPAPVTCTLPSVPGVDL